MIYSNTELVAEPYLYTKNETLYQVRLGKEVRGSQYRYIASFEGPKLESGMHYYLSLGTTFLGEPRLVFSNHSFDPLYLILSSKDRWTIRNGTIKILKSKKEEFKVISRGQNISNIFWYWDCACLKSPDNGIVRASLTSGKEIIYLIHNQTVFTCTAKTLANRCKALGIDIPCKMSNGSFTDDWVDL